jgi:hypothetical protein
LIKSHQDVRRIDRLEVENSPIEPDFEHPTMGRQSIGVRDIDLCSGTAASVGIAGVRLNRARPIVCASARREEHDGRYRSEQTPHLRCNGRPVFK